MSLSNIEFKFLVNKFTSTQGCDITKAIRYIAPVVCHAVNGTLTPSQLAFYDEIIKPTLLTFKCMGILPCARAMRADSNDTIAYIRSHTANFAPMSTIVTKTHARFKEQFLAVLH